MPVKVLWGILNKAGKQIMSLVRRFLFRGSVLSILLTAAVLAILVFAIPQPEIGYGYRDLPDHQISGPGYGYGGGGSPPEGVTFIYDYINPENRFVKDVIAKSWDKKVSLLMKERTIAETSIGTPLAWVSIKPMVNPPEPPEDASIIGIPYDLKPDWATFSPPARITFKYDPASILINH